MRKKIVATSIALSAMLLFIGCGSSDDTSSTPTGTAYYIDSAVSGINYTCGDTSGITGADGSFTFEIGGSCTFYLGDIELRSVDASLLEDEKKIYETDVEIARVLQSLDTDGDPTNGITLNADIIKAISDAGITSLPETVEEMNTMLQVIETSGGIVVTEDEAQAHLDITLEEAIAAGDLPAPTEPTPAPTAPAPAPTAPAPAPTAPAPAPALTLTDVIGKTVYSSCGTDELMKLTFGTDGIIKTVETFEGNEKTGEMPYRIDGNILYTIEDGTEDPHTFAGMTSETLVFSEDNGGTTTFYFTAAAAEANPEDCGGDSNSIPVPANNLVSGIVEFSNNTNGDSYADLNISTDRAWIRITPTVFSNDEFGYNGLQCEINPNDGSFGSNCFIHHDEDGVRNAFAANGATFSYGVFRDSNVNTNWDCEEDYFGGANDVILAYFSEGIIAMTPDTYRAGTPCQ